MLVDVLKSKITVHWILDLLYNFPFLNGLHNRLGFLSMLHWSISWCLSYGPLTSF